MMAPLDQDTENSGKDVRWSDSWDGYAATRKRLLKAAEKREQGNVVVVSGDIHQFWANELHLPGDEGDGPVVATEFVGSSITSGSGPWAEKYLPANPHLKFHDWKHRGYGLAEITPAEWRTEFRAVRSVADPSSEAFTLQRFVVEDGKAGVINA